MQTFMPYDNFEESAKCLDYRRLGKQRVEAKQIIDLLEKYDAGIDISKLPWGNHPAVRMWIGYTISLKDYYNDILSEWISRGYNNNMPFLFTMLPKLYNIKKPEWFGRPDFHDAHKSNLLRKDKEFYGKYNWDIPDDLPYKWK